MIKRNKREAGSALLTALIVIIIVGGLAGGFLSLSLSRNQVTYGATQSDRAFHIAEAGIDDVINKMNAYAQATGGQGGTVPTGADFAVIGIPTQSPTGNGIVNLVLGTVSGGSYSVEVSPAYAGRGTYTLSSTGTYLTSRRGIRTVVHPTSNGSAFAYGLFGDKGISGSGGIYTDGYSLSKGSYASQAVNTGNGKTYADATGSVGTNQSISLSGNATVFGAATPGPTGTVTTSGNVMVAGSTAPANAPVVNPPVVYTPPTGLASQGTMKLSGGTTTLAGGSYVYDSISTSGQSSLQITGAVTLYLNGDLSVSGQSSIQLSPGASLTIYQSSAGSIKVSGGGFVNQTADPKNLFVYSASTTDVDISGGSDFYGAVYAPQALFKPSGGSQFYGSFIAGSVQISGGATFHYDEDLGQQPSAIPVYHLLSWGQFTP